MKITSFLSNLTIGNLLEMIKYKITALKHPSCPKAYYKRLQFSNGGIRVGTWLANHRNNSFATKIRRHSKEVGNYRPITCITTMYITLIGMTAKRISTHVKEQNLPLAQQKGHHPRSKDCKDQLMISKAICDDCKRRNKNLSIAWIDYQKAFDSIPYSWVEKSIELVGVKLLDFVNYQWRNGTQGSI
jgi:hypothetical protein